jgi:NAD-dependent SIR2 family protein deacetylase
MGFLDIKNLKSIGFDDSFLSIGTCSKFVYLTSSMNKVEGDATKDFLTIWINILLVDSFNRVPEVAHFKSSKIFKMTFDKNKNSLDLLQQARMYHNGEDYFLLLQYPR